MNKQNNAAQFDGSETPCPDMAKDLSHAESFLYVAEPGSPAKVGIVPMANEFQSQNLYVISEQEVTPHGHHRNRLQNHHRLV